MDGVDGDKIWAALKTYVTGPTGGVAPISSDEGSGVVGGVGSSIAFGF